MSTGTKGSHTAREREHTTARGWPAGLPVYKLTRQVSKILRSALILLFVLIFIIPFIWIGFWGLKTETEISRNPFSPPIPPHWENLARVWTIGQYSKYLPNTLIYAFTIAAGVCLFSCLAGYALASIPFPGRQVIFTFFLIGLMVPFFAVMIPIYFLVANVGILGTRWALIIPGIALALPFGIFLMRSFFLALPEALNDAAKIDGCGEWQTFARVMLPLASPGLTTLAVFEFLWTWNMFVEPLVLVQRDPLRPVGLAILLFQARYTIDRAMVAGGLLLTILPVIVMYLLLQHKFVEGITAGALK